MDFRINPSSASLDTTGAGFESKAPARPAPYAATQLPARPRLSPTYPIPSNETKAPRALEDLAVRVESPAERERAWLGGRIEELSVAPPHEFDNEASDIVDQIIEQVEALKKKVRDANSGVLDILRDHVQACDELLKSLVEAKKRHMAATGEAISPMLQDAHRATALTARLLQRISMAKAECSLRTEADARLKHVNEKINTEIIGHREDELPPPRHNVTLEHAYQALREMLPNMRASEDGGIEGISLTLPGGLYIKKPTGSLDPRFMDGIELMPPGREMLRDYYARKYGARIEFFDHSVVAVTKHIAPFIETARQGGGDVRRALILSHGGGHGSALVYMREGAREAVLWFDPVGKTVDLPLGDALAAACPPALDGRPIEVFQPVVPIQHDANSCWAFSMKAAITLTGRQPGPGGFGEYLMPGALENLASRRAHSAGTGAAQPVWLPPQIARLSQYLKHALNHAGLELDELINDAKPGVTMRTTFEKYAYKQSKLPQEMEYMRHKGIELSVAITTEALNQQIGQALGPMVWDTAAQNEFAARMKVLVRNAPSSSA